MNKEILKLIGKLSIFYSLIILLIVLPLIILIMYHTLYPLFAYLIYGGIGLAINDVCERKRKANYE